MIELTDIETEILQLDKSSWEKVRFGKVAIQQKGRVNRDNTQLTKYVKGEHMGSQDLHLREWGELKDEYLGPAFIRYFEKNDILYGSRRTYLRKVVVAPFEGITSNTTYVIKANEKLIDKRLLPFVMMSEGFTDHSIKNSKGSVNPYVNWKDLTDYEFLLPPKAEQARLAELLWAMDEVIEKEKGVYKRNHIIKSVYLNKFFNSKKRSQNKRIETLCKVSSGNTAPQGDRYTYSESATVLLRANNIFNSDINYNDVYYIPIDIVKKPQLLIKGDFAICMSSGSKDLVGKAARFEGLNKNVTIGSFCAALRPMKDMYSDLLNHLFASESYRHMIKRILSGSTINNLKPDDIENLSFRIDLKNTSYNSLLESLNFIVDNMIIVEQKISSSQSLQKSLINQMF